MIDDLIAEFAKRAGFPMWEDESWKPEGARVDMTGATEKDLYMFAKMIIEECTEICEEYSEDKWALYKGHSPYVGNEDGRASDIVQGQSDGGSDCADAIRNIFKDVWDARI